MASYKYEVKTACQYNMCACKYGGSEILILCNCMMANDSHKNNECVDVMDMSFDKHVLNKTTGLLHKHDIWLVFSL